MWRLDVASLAGKIIENHLNVFEIEENLLQNGMLHFVSQLSEIELRS